MTDRLESGLLPWPESAEVTDLPLKVVPDWDEQVEHASRVCRLIDRHLNFEARGRCCAQATDFRPEHLCPEQRVQMVSDMYGACADADR
jgi:hypothetical protein